MMAKLAWFCVALACTAYWVTNIPVPEGYEDPWTFRFICIIMKVIGTINGLKEYLYKPEDILIAARSSSAPSYPEGIVVHTEDLEFDKVKVRVYVPEGLQPSQNPAVVYYHGGGWTVGNVDSYNGVCKVLANGTRTVVVSVEYRLAPEHPYPAAFDDCLAATTYFIKHAEQFAVNPKRIAVAGDSAGGNLAAAISLHLRDIDFQPQPKLQVLIYPCLQMVDFDTPSYQLHKNGLLRRRMLTLVCLLYATGESKYFDEVLANKHVSPQMKHKFAENQLKHDVILQDYPYDYYTKPDLNSGDEKVWKDLQPTLMDPYFSPLMAKDLTNLPDAIIFTVEHDVLRDDGIWYAKHMKDASNQVTHIHYKAGSHGILSGFMNQKNVIEAQEMLYDAIKSKL